MNSKDLEVNPSMMHKKVNKVATKELAHRLHIAENHRQIPEATL